MIDIFLLDTSAWVPVLRINPLESLRKRVDQLLKENSAAIMPIVKVELLGGTKNEIEFERLNKRLNSLIYLDMNNEVWNKASKLAYDLKRNGITVPYIDIMIAATAIHHNATLLHLDKHFDIIASKSPLKLESYSVK